MSASSGVALELRGVTVRRESRKGLVQVTRSVDVRVGPGERVFLLGPNGAGKTSLLLAVVGAVPFDGVIRFGDLDVGTSTLAAVRSRTGFVFADPSDQLFTDEVTEEVAFGPRERELPEVERRVREALEAVALEHHGGRSPRDLSLGEQRRLAIATALAVTPELLLLDEPTAGLDPRARRRVLDVVSNLSSTVLLATHDMQAVRELGGRAVLLCDGAVIAQGSCDEVLSNADWLDRAGLSV